MTKQTSISSAPLDGFQERIDALFGLDWRNEIGDEIARRAFSEAPSIESILATVRESITSLRGRLPTPNDTLESIKATVHELAVRGASGGDAYEQERARRRRREELEIDVARSTEVRLRDLDSLGEGLVEAARLIRACTPSVILRQPIANDVLLADTSVSFGRLGSPVESSGVFGRICGRIQDFYGVEHAWALVNGSSGANWSVARLLRLRLIEDQVVLVSRGSHVSVPQSLTDFGIPWRYIDCAYIESFEAVLPPTAAELKLSFDKAVEEGESVGAVWVNGPSYEGVMVDTAGLRDVIDKECPEAILIVDEAWGSHLPGSRSLSEKVAAKSGADLANASTHKAAGGLQGTAVLVRGTQSRLTPMEVDASVKALYSTSPSFHLLASVEATYSQLHRYPWMIPALEINADDLRSQLARHCEWLTFFEDDMDLDRGPIDPLKVTLGVHRCESTGIELGRKLEAEGVVVEKTGVNTVTFLMTHQLSPQDIGRMVGVFDQVTRIAGVNDTGREPPPNAFAVATGNPVDPSGAARRAIREYEVIGIADCVGREAGERVAVYPPGIPLFVEGQIITREHVDFVEAARQYEAHFVRSGGVRGRPGETDTTVMVLPAD